MTVVHQHEIVTQKLSMLPPPGHPNIISHYFTCTCGYSGSPRRLFSMAVEDRSAHLNAVREAEDGSTSSKSASNADGVGQGSRLTSAGSNSEVVGVRSSYISRAH